MKLLTQRPHRMQQIDLPFGVCSLRQVAAAGLIQVLVDLGPVLRQEIRHFLLTDGAVARHGAVTKVIPDCLGGAQRRSVLGHMLHR